MSGEELKPAACPFCGCPFAVINRPIAGNVKLSVKCPSCHSHGGYGATEAEAIAAWNKRAHPLPEQPQEGEHIADAGKMVATHPNTDQGVTAEVTQDCYLLVKRGLYYRPGNQGYTGIKEYAGRYPASDASPDDGVTAIHEDEAPEYSQACYHDLAAQHAAGKAAALEAEIAFLKQRLESAEEVLRRFTECARYDPHMDGSSTFIGWQQSELRRVEVQARTFLQEQEKQNG